MLRSTLALVPILLLCACGKDPDPPYGDDTNPLTRTDEQLCRHWKAEHVPTAGPEWIPGDGSTCDLGTVPDAAQQNGVRRTNVYRWLVGLPSVPYDSLYDSQQQYCAALETGLGTLSHCTNGECRGSICDSSDGELGAGESNISEGSGLADSVDAFIGDQGENNFHVIGHRRWALDPALASVTFGFKQQASRLAFGCMHVQARLPPSQTPKVDYIAYPPPGPVPLDAALGRFSFASNLYLAGSTTKVLVTIDGGPEASVPFEVGTPAPYIGTMKTFLIFDPIAGHFEQTSGLFLDGRTVQIHITGLQKAGAAAEVTFEMRFVSCS